MTYNYMAVRRLAERLRELMETRDPDRWHRYQAVATTLLEEMPLGLVEAHREWCAAVAALEAKPDTDSATRLLNAERAMFKLGEKP